MSDEKREPEPREKTRLDNPPACGAPKDWPWGYLPCGCTNDGYGRHAAYGGTRP